MNKQNDGGPAFPQNIIDPSKGHDDGRYEVERQELGMSLRDWFAGQALNGLISRFDDLGANPKEAAEAAVGHADALIARLNKEPTDA